MSQKKNDARSNKFRRLIRASSDILHFFPVFYSLFVNFVASLLFSSLPEKSNLGEHFFAVKWKFAHMRIFISLHMFTYVGNYFYRIDCVAYHHHQFVDFRHHRRRHHLHRYYRYFHRLLVDCRMVHSD